MPFSRELALQAHCNALLAEHEVFIRENFDDLPGIKLPGIYDWVWSA